MISATTIKDEIKKNKNHLFKSFFAEQIDNSYFFKIKKLNKFKTVVVIGMGGSILGSKAIYSFLKHKIKKKFIFIDNLDQVFLEKIRNEENLSKTLFLLISKSGNTSETIINSSYFKTFLKKTNVIVISENKNNILSKLARKKNFIFFKHNHFIGGRYSVFSEVGMVPAYLMGLNVKKIKSKLPKILKNKNILSNSIRSISNINKKKIKILIFFNYIPELNDFLFWAQQLFAESLGKNKKGFIPVISNSPKDHHSLMQLYLDGPRDKMFYVFSSNKYKKMKLNCDFFGKEMRYLKKRSYQDVKISQKNAFIKILREKRIPFREFKINNFDESTLGELFLKFMFETIGLAKIMKVNPYDQPAVEKVKILTKKFLIS